jgi:hypothetical protein
VHGFARFGRELLDPGFVSALAEAGLLDAQLGLETGSQALLDRMGKGDARRGGVGGPVEPLAGRDSQPTCT